MYRQKYYRVVIENQVTGERVTSPFEDWVYENRLVQPIEDVIEDWAYSVFDKSPSKIVELEEISFELYIHLRQEGRETNE